MRPFRSPHHTISDAGLIGGGAVPRPGEVSLAHNGVLIPGRTSRVPPQCSRGHAPAAGGRNCVHRPRFHVADFPRALHAGCRNESRVPADTSMIVSRECHCTPPVIQRYMSKISGPLLDRIDIHIDVPAVNYKEMRSGSEPESSAKIRERVMRARGSQLERFLSSSKRQAVLQCANGAAPHSRFLRTFRGLRTPVGAGHGPARTDRSRPRPNSESSTHHCGPGRGKAIEPKHIAEAIQYRTLDRTFWA